MNVTAPVEVKMRRIAATDNAAIASVIRQVSAEYGLTADKGYTVADPELDELYQLYSREGCAYWVVELNGDVVGGGGIKIIEQIEGILLILRYTSLLFSINLIISEKPMLVRISHIISHPLFLYINNNPDLFYPVFIHFFSY